MNGAYTATTSEIQLIWQLKCNADHAHTAAANVDQQQT